MSLNSSPIPFPTSAVAPPNGNILVPPTPLLGRDRERHEVTALLDRDDLRLVTLVGPGGVGKTRLAVDIMRRVEPELAGGALFVALDALRDCRLVPRAVGSALGIREDSDRGYDDALASALAERHMLLVLDNIEQVIGAGRWLASVLSRCPRLRVLATSRRPFNIAAEQLYPLEPLPVPNDAGLETAAVALFVERARAMRLDIEIDEATITSIAEICRRLDGLPLAIELAAAHTSVASPEALLARLTHRLSLLSGGRVDSPVRLRSMRDAIGWSYDLLGSDAQRLFRRLAAFRSSFALDTVAFAVAWPDPPESEVEAIARLQPILDQSLVQRLLEENGIRFRMLETIREYAIEVERDGDADRIHAEYYLDLANSAGMALTGSDQAAWLDRLESEYANIRVALDWLESHDRLADAVELAIGIKLFVIIRGHTTELRERVERWMANPALATRGRTWGLALLTLGSVLQNTGDLARSADMLVEAVDVLHDAGDRWFETEARDELAGTYGFLGDDERMQEVAAGTIAMARQLGCHRSVSENLGYLATHAQRAGNTAAARTLLNEAFRVAVQHGDGWVIAFHLRDRAAAAWNHGHLDEAEARAEEARVLFESLGSQRDVPAVWLVLALIAHDRGDLDAASHRVATGLSIALAIGHHTWDVDWLNLVGTVVDAERGDLASARETLATTLGHLDPHLQPLEAAQCFGVYVCLAAHAGDLTDARRFQAASDRLLREARVDLAQPGTHLMMKWVARFARAAPGAPAPGRAIGEHADEDIEAAIAAALSYCPSAATSAPVAPSRRFGLSRREMDVLRLMADGLSNQQVADALNVSLRTVASHVTSVLTKLNLPSRTAAVAFAIRNGLA